MSKFLAMEREVVKPSLFSPTTAVKIAVELLQAGVPVAILPEVTEPRRLTIAMDCNE
jgi:hypothetical protein